MYASHSVTAQVKHKATIYTTYVVGTSGVGGKETKDDGTEKDELIDGFNQACAISG